MHVPGPLPAGVRPQENRSLAVQVPGVFAMPLPTEPQAFAIQANMAARNPNLVVNTGFRFFDTYDFYLDAKAGIRRRARQAASMSPPLPPAHARSRSTPSDRSADGLVPCAWQPDSAGPL